MKTEADIRVTWPLAKDREDIRSAKDEEGHSFRAFRGRVALLTPGLSDFRPPAL